MLANTASTTTMITERMMTHKWSSYKNLTSLSAHLGFNISGFQGGRVIGFGSQWLGLVAA